MKREARIDRLFGKLTGEELARLSIANFVDGVEDALSGRPPVERHTEARKIRDRARLLPDHERHVFDDMTNAAIDVEHIARVAVPPLVGLAATELMMELGAEGWDAAARAREALGAVAAQATVLAQAVPALALALGLPDEDEVVDEPRSRAGAFSGEGPGASVPPIPNLSAAISALAVQLAEARDYAAMLREGWRTTAATRVEGAAKVRRQIESFAPRLRDVDPLPPTIRRMLEQAESQPVPPRRFEAPKRGTTSRRPDPAPRRAGRVRTK